MSSLVLRVRELQEMEINGSALRTNQGARYKSRKLHAGLCKVVCLPFLSDSSTTVLLPSPDGGRKNNTTKTNIGLFSITFLYPFCFPSSQRQYYKYFTLNECTAKMHSKLFSSHMTCSETQLQV